MNELSANANVSLKNDSCFFFCGFFRYGEAADTIRLEIGIHQENGNGAAIGRLTVALVLVQLVREDSVAAEKAFKEWGNYCDGQEAVTLESLLQVNILH